MPLEPLDEPSRLGSREGLVKRGGFVGVEIVIYQNDRRRLRNMDVGSVLQHMGVIDGRVALRHLGVSPAFERREHHE